MPGAFQAGAKERLVCGFVVPSCNHFCSPPQKQDVTEDKGLKKKRVAEDDEIELQEAGGLGGAQPPQKQDVTEEKGLEKKRVIESEGSGLKEAGGLGGTQPPGREWFGSKYL